MKPLPVLALAVLLALPSILRAVDAETQIKAVLNTQVDAWNHGDIPTFVTTYATDCIFVGKPVTQGRAQLLDHYRKKYPSRAAMGQLSFSTVVIHLLDPNVAIVTAEWRLDRSDLAGGATGGIFSLVFRRQNGAWKIALDHTS